MKKPPIFDLKTDITALIALALSEDLGQGDITSNLLIPADLQATMEFRAREGLIACGMSVLPEVFRQIDPTVRIAINAEEGKKAHKDEVLAVAKGNARALLAGERLALNLMQRLSGVASLTQRYVEAVSGTNAVILDTRKTMPGMRALDKFAVLAGGGQNHRMRLDDMVLIKDNHIALCGGIKEAVAKARAGCSLPIVVECDTLAQVEEAALAKPDRILLDNMNPETLAAAVKLVAGRVALEASGGVSLETVKAIADTGVGYISVGRLTHSAVAADIGADISFH